MVPISEMFSKKWFRRDILVILGFLVLQFILGMILNLFVSSPNIPVGSTDRIYLNAIFTTPVLLGHFIVGVGLLLGSIWILVGAIKTKARNISLVAVLGFISILTAYISGSEFVLSGFQNDLFSFTMSIGFIVALLSYFKIYQLSGRIN